MADEEEDLIVPAPAQTPLLVADLSAFTVEEINSELARRSANTQSNSSPAELAKNMNAVKMAVTTKDLFDGSFDAENHSHHWLEKLELIFETAKVTNPIDRFEMLGLRIKSGSRAWTWFRSHYQDWNTWDEAKESFLATFHVTGRKQQLAFRHQLNSLRQTSKVMSYIVDFETIANQIETLGEDEVICYFMAGLRPALAKELLVHDYKTVAEVKAAAINVEAAYMTIRLSSAIGTVAPYKPYARKDVPPPRRAAVYVNNIETEDRKRPKLQSVVGNARRRELTADEARCRAEGRCFRCRKSGHPESYCQGDKNTTSWPPIPNKPRARANAVFVDEEGTKTPI